MANVNAGRDHHKNNRKKCSFLFGMADSPIIERSNYDTKVAFNRSECASPRWVGFGAATANIQSWRQCAAAGNGGRFVPALLGSVGRRLSAENSTLDIDGYALSQR